jgi:hypothetical protein
VAVHRHRLGRQGITPAPGHNDAAVLDNRIRLSSDLIRTEENGRLLPVL